MILRWVLMGGLALLSVVCWQCCSRIVKVPSVYRTYYQEFLWWGLLGVLICLLIQELIGAVPLLEEVVTTFLRQGTFQAIAICVLIIIILLGTKWHRFPCLREGLMALLAMEVTEVILRYRPDWQLPSLPQITIGLMVVELVGIGLIFYATFALYRELWNLTSQMKRRRSQDKDTPSLSLPPD